MVAMRDGVSEIVQYSNVSICDVSTARGNLRTSSCVGQQGCREKAQELCQVTVRFLEVGTVGG